MAVLRQSEAGEKITNIVRKVGISEGELLCVEESNTRGWESVSYGSCGKRTGRLKRRVADLSQIGTGTVGPASLPEHVRYAYRRLTVPLRQKGWKVNAKRIYRLYTEEQDTVRTKRWRKIAPEARSGGNRDRSEPVLEQCI